MTTFQRVTYPPANVSDNSGQMPSITYTIPSGSNFNIGTTVVTVTARDSSGNQAECIFAVTVNSKFSTCTLSSKYDMLNRFNIRWVRV